jgi:hypothetical protein
MDDEQLDAITERILELLEAEPLDTADALFVALRVIGAIVASEACPGCRKKLAKGAKRLFGEILADAVMPREDDDNPITAITTH